MVMALIYTMVGEQDRAIDELDYLLSIDSPSTVHSIELNPEFEPLHDSPRFQALLEKYRRNGRGT